MSTRKKKRDRKVTASLKKKQHDALNAVLKRFHHSIYCSDVNCAECKPMSHMSGLRGEK